VAGLIEQTIQSVLSQSFKDWEWIIVDDQSEDNTVSIVRSVQDSRIRVVEASHVGNLSVLRNLGARNSNGDLLAFLDGDDIVTPRKLDAQNALFDKYSTLGWSHTNALTLVHQTGELLPRGMPLPSKEEFLGSEKAFANLVRRNFIYVSSVMVKRSAFDAVGGFNEKFNRCEDIDLWLRLAAGGFDLGYVHEPMLHYRVRPSGLFSSKTLEYLNTNFIVYQDLEQKFPSLFQKYSHSVRQYYSDNYLKIAIHKLHLGDKNFVSELRRAYECSPSLKKYLWLKAGQSSSAMLRKYVQSRGR
jgi:glycosyltransferase involved in cell wall biosynthesis